MNVQYFDVEGIMKVELTINKSKDLPRGAIPALEKELLKRLQNQYGNCSLVIGAHIHNVVLGSHNHAITVNAAGNTENTVKNTAFNYLVRLA